MWPPVGTHVRFCHCKAPTGPRQSPGSCVRLKSPVHRCQEIATSASPPRNDTVGGADLHYQISLSLRGPAGAAAISTRRSSDISRRAATSGRPYGVPGSASRHSQGVILLSSSDQYLLKPSPMKYPSTITRKDTSALPGYGNNMTYILASGENRINSSR